MNRALLYASSLIALGAGIAGSADNAIAQDAPSNPPEEVKPPPQSTPRGSDRPRRRPDSPRRDPRAGAPEPAIEPGVKVRTPQAQPGYTLYAPISSTDTYLVDLYGQRVHTWPSGYTPGHAVYLLDDGSILRTCREPESFGFEGGGQGGRIQKIAWDGSIEWDYPLASRDYLQHHDIELMPNGNILAVVWERVSAAKARALGVPEQRLESGEFWPDAVYEIKPTGPRSGEIVWRWRSLDHTIQNVDPKKPNYGNPAEHPGKMDLGFGASRRGADWLHTNAVAYNPELDQIALSIHGTNELWIIDHALTTEEAAGPKGDILYRWGNPATYGLGGPEDQTLHLQHDVHWIKPGFPGAGDLLVFDNQAGGQRGPRKRPGTAPRGGPQESYSAVLQLTPPMTPEGSYTRASGRSFGPEKATWRVDGKDAPTRFYSQNISGAQRLPNGNTLICSGAEGRFIEVTPEGRTVWEFIPPPSATPDRRRPPTGAQGEGRQARPGRQQGRPEGAGARERRGRPGGGRGIFRCERILPTHPAIKAHEAELQRVGGAEAPKKPTQE